MTWSPKPRPRGHPAFASFLPFPPPRECQLSRLTAASGGGRRGKQVPGCQSRTRAEQERTGLNRREQIPAGRRAPPPARPAIHTAYVAGSRSLACWAGGGAGRGGRGASVLHAPAGDRFELARATLTPFHWQRRRPGQCGVGGGDQTPRGTMGRGGDPRRGPTQLWTSLSLFLPPQPRRSLPGVRAREPVCTCRGTGFVSAQRETSAHGMYLTPFSRKTGRWTPADPVRPSSLGLGLAAQVAPRAARHFTRPPGAFRTYSPDTPSHVFRVQGQATVGRQKVMRRGHPQKPGEGRGRDLYRRTPVPSLAPTGAPHSPHRPRPIQSGAGIALATG